MKCINCRCVIPDTSDYCVYCGHVVERGDEPTFPVRYSGYETAPVQPPVFHSLAAYDDPNQYYGIPEENDGSDAYDTYYESNYPGYRPVDYSAVSQNGVLSHPSSGSGLDLTTLLWCFAGLDFIIILLLLIILLMML
ncbi:hypothetical protein [Ruminococcus sp.]|uniref:hypothetical protein n=1 Tax=Ruminococcus sp. TaxID=41978 RepID=UPI0038904A57